MADWREQSRARQKAKSEGASIKIAEGANCVRVLPDKKDIQPNGKVGPKGCTHQPFREYHLHYGVGPDENTVACGYDIEGNGSCWLCDVKLPELANSTSPKKQKYASRMERKEAFLVQACTYDPDTERFSSPKPWSVSTGSGLPGRQQNSLAVRVMGKINSSKKDYIDPVKGYNLNIERQGQMLHTRYTEVEGDESPTTVPPEILKRMVDLDSLVKKYDEEDQKAAYFGRARRGGESEEDEERPRRFSKPKAKAQAEDEGEEDDAAEYDAEDEEAEEADEESEESEESEDTDEETDEEDEESADDEDEVEEDGGAGVDEEAEDEESEPTDDEEEPAEEEPARKPTKPTKTTKAPPAKKPKTKASTNHRRR